MGVDVFFTLSGILITRMWLRETAARHGAFNFARFAARRYLRLAPMLVLGILAQLAAAAAGGVLPAKLNACANDWWRLLLMINNYTRGSPDDACLLQAWSVAVEMQLYLVAPLVLWGVWQPAAQRPRRWWWAGLAAVWAIPPVLRGALAGTSPLTWQFLFNRWGISNLPLAYTSTPARASPFVAGMAAALAVELAKRKRRAQAAPAALKDSDAVVIEVPAVSGALGGDTDRQVVDESSVPATLPGQQPAGAAAQAAAAEPRRRLRRTAALLLCADVFAFLVCLGLAWLGVGVNRHTSTLSLDLDLFLTVLGRPLFGAALAWVLGATLLGRCRPIEFVVGSRLWLPAASLSYGAYLLQDLPLDRLPSWTLVGVTTSLFAGWAVYLLSYALFTLASLGLALPCFLLVEMPAQRLVKRGY
ncbi:rhy-1 [Scenedesmus sp. PABB004]|nr:rhy-1 [Scenedesmus sp. PABB004]